MGKIGEDYAVVFLMKHSFKILGRNLNSRNGEIDIVAKKKKVHYFFEVKAGRQGSWFNPADNLAKEKLRRFHNAVQYYCLRHRCREYKIQGILVLLDTEEKIAPRIEIIDLS